MSLLTQWQSKKEKLNTASALSTWILEHIEFPYLELEYIQSSGTQFINTGIALNTSGSRMILDFQLTSKTSNKWIAGVNESFEAGTTNGTSFYTGAKFTYSQNSNITTRTTATGTASNISTVSYLFARNWNNNRDPASMKLYSCQMYKNNNLVRDFIPVQRRLDGVVCLYDKVSETYFTNQGTGVFTAGPVKS